LHLGEPSQREERDISYPLFGESIDEGIVTAARQVMKVLDTNYLGDSLSLREPIRSDVAETAA